MMMFKTALVAVVLTLIGSASAAPYVRPQAKLAQRDIQALGVRYIPAQVPEVIVRGEHYRDVEEREIPEEVPTKATKGDITAYQKRDTIPAEIAVKTDANGNVVAYDKRNEDEGELVKRTIPAEIAVKTDPQGNIVPFKRDEDESYWIKRTIPAEIAVKTDPNGNIVPF